MEEGIPRLGMAHLGVDCKLFYRMDKCNLIMFY